MHVGILTEMADRERRVALVPPGVEKLVAGGHSVSIEAGAGSAAGYTDSDYEEAGARVVPREDVLVAGGVLAQVRVTGTHGHDDGVLGRLSADHVLIGLAEPVWRADNAARLAATGATVLALELVPRITRAQTMDALSAMATVSGYEAVLLAAAAAPRMFPMLMTAAGTVPPTRLFVLGAGVAGLQAIATSRRLGAVVEAFDVRPAAMEQIESLGAKAVALDLDTAASEDSGGYARAQSEDQELRQQRLLTPHLADSDVLITTAAIPGRASPRLVTEAMVEAMRPGSVVVDLAAERGGNCTLTRADEVVVHRGVEIHGPTDLPSRSARTASLMLSNNIVTLLSHLDSDGDVIVDADDEITGAMLVASGGSVVHPAVLDGLGQAPTAKATEG